MKRTVALLTSLALMIPGAAVASANSTTANYSHHGAVKHVTASRTPKHTSTCTTGTSGSGSSGSGTGSGSTQCVSAANTTQTEATSTGSLPFTGLDIGALAAGAVVL